MQAKPYLFLSERFGAFSVALVLAHAFEAQFPVFYFFQILANPDEQESQKDKKTSQIPKKQGAKNKAGSLLKVKKLRKALRVPPLELNLPKMKTRPKEI